VRIEQTLRRLEGVVHSTSDIRTGTIRAEWAPSVRLDLDRLKSKLFVWRGGVRFGAATATASGTVLRDERGWLLETGRTRQRFRLVAPTSGAATAAWAAVIDPHREATSHLRITGEVRGTGLELTLTVAAAEPARR
jgi:hypothetical protein